MPDIGGALKKSLLGGFSTITQGEANLGPFPVVNVFMEDTGIVEQPDLSSVNNTNTLKELLNKQRQVLKDMQLLLKKPISSFIEPNPPPYTEFNFFPTVQETNAGRNQPAVFSIATQVAGKAAEKAAKNAKQSADIAYLATMDGATEKLALLLKLETMLARLKLIRI
jgi:hypothetical protein